MVPAPIIYRDPSHSHQFRLPLPAASPRSEADRRNPLPIRRRENRWMDGSARVTLPSHPHPHQREETGEKIEIGRRGRRITVGGDVGRRWPAGNPGSAARESLFSSPPASATPALRWEDGGRKEGLWSTPPHGPRTDIAVRGVRLRVGPVGRFGRHTVGLSRVRGEHGENRTENLLSLLQKDRIFSN